MRGFPLKIVQLKWTRKSLSSREFISLLPKIDWAGVLSAAADVSSSL